MCKHGGNMLFNGGHYLTEMKLVNDGGLQKL